MCRSITRALAIALLLVCGLVGRPANAQQSRPVVAQIPGDGWLMDWVLDPSATRQWPDIPPDQSGTYLPFVTRAFSAPALTPPMLAPIDNATGRGMYDITWSAVSGATGYTLEENRTPVYQGSEPSYHASGKAPGHYCYQVKADSASGASGWSNTECTDVVPGAPVLGPIDNPLGLRSFSVQWTAVSGADGYSLEESTNVGFVGAVTVYTGPAADWAATDKLPNTYYYRVKANGPAGDSSWSNTQQTSPSAPLIEFTSIPDYGKPGYLYGRVRGVVPADHKIAVYIFVSGWWTKPYWASPLTSIAADGTWLANISTGGNDPLATQIAAFLVPNGYLPPSMSGQPTLPPELYANALAYLIVERHPIRTVSFAGRVWYVKTAQWNADPGPCYYSDQPEDVWVDDQGRLHLKIAHRDNRWYCAEVFSADITGLGTYTFTLASPVDQFDPNVVLGLFTYDDTDPAYSHREIDIEFARWGVPTGPNSQYVVQPYTGAGHRYQFNMAIPELYSMHRFIWSPDSVTFASFAGNQSPPDPSNQLNTYAYAGSDIPPAGNGNARINLWLFGGVPPSDNREVEVIVQDFQHTP